MIPSLKRPRPTHSDVDPATRRQEKIHAFSRDMEQAALERKVIAAESAHNELEMRLLEKENMIEQLEADRRWLAEREKEEREAKEAHRQQWLAEKTNLETTLRLLRATHSSLKDEHASLQDKHRDLNRTTTRTIESQKADVTKYKWKIDMLNEQLAEMSLLADERAKTISELQDDLENTIQHKEDDSRREREESNWSIVQDELTRQMDHVRELETANMRLISEVSTLRDRCESLPVLREEKLQLEKKLKAADNLRDQLEADLYRTIHERDEWASQTTKPASGEQPAGVTHELAELRVKIASLLDANGQLVAESKRYHAQLAQSDQFTQDSVKRISAMEIEIQTLQEDRAKAERRAGLAERQAAFLQELNATYSAEENGDISMEERESSSAQKIQQLEEVLDGYKSMNVDLQKELEALKAKPPPRVPDVKPIVDTSSQAALAEAKKVVQTQAEQIDNLEQTLFELRGTIAQGNHVPPGVRVLSLRDNPLQQWEDLRQEVMDRIKAENRALLARLAELETRQAASSSDAQLQSLVPRASYDSVRKEKESLDDLLAQKEKRLARLQQVFAAKGKEFRETMTSILGYKVKFYENGQVRVTSIYDLSVAFVFQPSSPDGAKMQLVGGGDGEIEGLNLQQTLQHWVIDRASIPCFLASMTLECYEKTEGRHLGWVHS